MQDVIKDLHYNYDDSLSLDLKACRDGTTLALKNAFVLTV